MSDNNDRSAMIRKAHSLPSGSEERRDMLAAVKQADLEKEAISKDTQEFTDWVMLNMADSPMSERAMIKVVEKILGREPSQYVSKKKRGPNVEVGDMLYDLHVENDVEGAAVRGQGLRQDAAVLDVEAGLLGVHDGCLHVLLAGVNAGDAGAEALHGLGQEAAAAPDVEHVQSTKGFVAERVAPEAPGHPVADEGNAGRVDGVQGTELAPGVPPFLGQRREAGDLVGRGGAAGVGAGSFPRGGFAGHDPGSDFGDGGRA